MARRASLGNTRRGVALFGLYCCVLLKECGVQANNVSNEQVSTLSHFFFTTNGPSWRINQGWDELQKSDDNSLDDLDPCCPIPWYKAAC
jgi:hypothetical protein